jgi:hypothetical protein
MEKLFENWRRFVNEQKDASLDNWEYEDAKGYAQELTDEYGEPDVLTNNMALWNGRISEFTQTYVKDESIPHCCPKPHNDYVYSTMVIDVPEELMEAIAKASESIIVDQLKNEVTARCADIYANAITLGFVQKLVKGDIDPEDSKEEYERHILEGILPEWFEEKVEEGKKKKKKKKKKGGKKDACYHKVKSRYDVWPSAYASGALVKCRKVGAKNWGNKSSKKEGVEASGDIFEEIKDKPYRTDAQAKKDVNPAKLGLEEESLHQWFDDADGDGQGEWEQIGGKYDGKPCAKQPGQKTKPKCASPEKAASMSKKERDNAAKRKRAKDPNPNRKGKAKNVNTDPKKKKKKKKSKNESIEEMVESIIQEVMQELEEAAKCKGPTKKASSTSKGKKWMKCVKSDSGGYKRIHWGQKGVRVTGKSGDTKRKKSFKKRHKCSKAKSNTPQGQACKDWAE